MAEKVTEHNTDAGTGEWTRLAAEAARLHSLYQQGRLDEVLDAVEQHRATMTMLPDEPDAGQDVDPWSIREAILGVGVVAAHDLGRWPQALELNAAVRRSQEDRKATEVELAVTWFNDYGPLLRTGHAVEARDLLYKCRAAFGRAEDVIMMGNTLSALADADAHLGHVNLSVEQETDALRLKYQGSDPEAIAVSHYNLANYLISARQEPQPVWAHRLAAAVIRYQTDSPRFPASVQSIGRLVGRGDAEEAKAPMSFNDVCAMVDGLPEVRFAELFALLPDRAGGGQAAIDEIMRQTNSMRDSAVEESVAAWEPIISAMVVAQQPDAPAEVKELLEGALSELKEQRMWFELVIVLQRIQAGPGFHSEHTVEDIDPVSSAVARRARAALAGELTVDPQAWRALVEDD
jgi:hypothetical protein